MKKSLQVLMINLILLLFTVSAFAILYDGPYTGRVIDSDTREPIEGVVVLGVWYTVTATAGGGVSTYYDAQETVTDKDGEFKIAGLGLKMMDNTSHMDVLIFKAGYEHIGMGPWVGLKTMGRKGYEDSYDPVKNMIIHRAIYDQNKKVKWEGEKAIIPLSKLTMEDRRKRIPSPNVPSEAPLKKVRLILKEINKEDIEVGLDPINIWRGEKIE